ncbi:MAG TPA: DUF3300 domain-containing protein [Victivallales bacterium]|nr:DUF3300 domain-containing protein [Victivallales bacterium]
MRGLVLLASLFLTVRLAVAQEQQTQPTEGQKTEETAKFSKAQLEQLVAPIALYPDELLAQVLAASTYPVDIVEAERWLKNNPYLNQDEISSELKNKAWDASVKGLMFFPELLTKLKDNLDWTKDLGDAFMIQQVELMDTIQAMRTKAKEAGILKSDEKQNVTTNAEGQTEIEPTDPETVYVQDYDPVNSYGHWGHDDWYYPSVIVAPAWPYRRAYRRAWLGYNCGWGDHVVAYNKNFYSNSLYKNSLENSNINPANREWRHDHNRTKPSALNSGTAGDTSQSYMPVNSETSAKVSEFREKASSVDSAKVSEFREKASSMDRTQVSREALQKASSERSASRAQNSTQRKNLESSMAGSRNANLERNYSDRGARSRNMSTSSRNKSRGSTYSRSGGASRVSSRASRSGGGSRGGGRR